jgi:molybdopterin-guanine dinucleotide biosynthesis protein A
MKYVNISGVILAGGENRRFGGIVKAKEKIGGQMIIDRILNVTGKIFEEIIIVTNNTQEFNRFGNCMIVSDYIRNAGPISGIHSAMKNSTKDAIFVFAGDMPFLNEKLIRRQYDVYCRNKCDAVVPEWENDIEPLHGIYKCRLLSVLEKHINESEDFNIRRFLEKVDFRVYKPKPSPEVKLAFTNINSPADAAVFKTIVK